MPVDYTKPPQVRGEWKTQTEHVKFDTDHGLLVMPDGDGVHRLYYAGSPTQLAQILSVILAWAEKLPDQIIKLAERIERDNPDGEFR